MNPLDAFQWGGGGQKLSPQEVSQKRAIAQALMGKGQAPQNVGQGLNRVGEALLYNSLNSRANDAESAGRAASGDIFAALQDGDNSMGELMTAISDPYLQQNKGQSAVVQALMNQEMKKSDPAYQMGLEKSQLELDALRNPAPELPKAPTVQKITRPDGSQVAVQWSPESNNWVPIEAPEGGAAVSDKTKLTEGQSKLALFGRMQSETAPVLDGLEQQFDPANIPDAVARSAPLAGNFFQSEEGQIYNSAASAWSEGALRIATGAAATEPEIERMRNTYFAQVGDTPATIKFKSEMRKMYSRALDAAAGQNDIEGSLPDPIEFARSFVDDDATEGAPQQGEVVDGFVFKGGDPSDQNNWERAM